MAGAALGVTMQPMHVEHSVTSIFSGHFALHSSHSAQSQRSAFFPLVGLKHAAHTLTLPPAPPAPPRVLRAAAAALPTPTHVLGAALPADLVESLSLREAEASSLFSSSSFSSSASFSSSFLLGEGLLRALFCRTLPALCAGAFAFSLPLPFTALGLLGAIVPLASAPAAACCGRHSSGEH